MRLTFAFLLALSALVVSAPEACADEVFVLEGGVVLRGYVVREEEDRLKIRLSGLAEASTVTVERSAIVERFTASRPRSLRTPVIAPPPIRDESMATASPVQPAPSSSARRAPDIESLRSEERDGDVPPDAPIAPRPFTPAEVDLSAGGVEEETAPEESDVVFVKLARVAKIALPRDPMAQLGIGLLLAVLLTLLVGAGVKIIDLQTAGFAGAALLGTLLTGMVMANLLWPDHLLRTARALWLLPAQVLVWNGVARLLVGGPWSKVFSLFAFVFASVIAFFFLTGAVLVTI